MLEKPSEPTRRELLKKMAGGGAALVGSSWLSALFGTESAHARDEASQSPTFEQLEEFQKMFGANEFVSVEALRNNLVAIKGLESLHDRDGGRAFWDALGIDVYAFVASFPDTIHLPREGGSTHMEAYLRNFVREAWWWDTNQQDMRILADFYRKNAPIPNIYKAGVRLAFGDDTSLVLDKRVAAIHGLPDFDGKELPERITLDIEYHPQVPLSAHDPRRIVMKRIVDGDVPYSYEVIPLEQIRA